MDPRIKRIMAGCFLCRIDQFMEGSRWRLPGVASNAPPKRDNSANSVSWPGLALLALAAGSIAAPLLWHLSCFWQIDPQYCYGWIVPLLSIYLAWRRWKSRPAAEPAPSGTTICLAAALFLLSVVWLIREATPDWSVVSWILAIFTAGSLALLITSAGGLRMACHFLFPI